MDWEIAEPDPLPESEQSAEGSWFYALACTHCGHRYPLADITAMQLPPPESFPLRVHCPECQARGTYYVSDLIPTWREASS